MRKDARGSKGPKTMEMKLELVNVPVSDVDIAKAFYSKQAGFVVDHDTQISDEMRIVQLTPPGSACSIAISAGMIRMLPGSLQGLQLVVRDIEATRAALIERGVDASVVSHFENGQFVEGHGGDWNAFVSFSDPDGNEWTLQERPSGAGRPAP